MTAPASNTPNSIISDSMGEAGLLREGTNPTPEQFAKYLRRLIDLINVWQTQGLKLWLNVDTNVPLTAGQMTYTFLPGGNVDMTKPLRVLEGYYLYTATNSHRPLTPISWNDLVMLGQVGTLTGNQGTITQYFVNKKQTSLEVTFWLCPDSTEAANGSVHLLLQVQVTNPTMLNETVTFPIEWRLPLVWGLAAEICTGQPQDVIARCEGKANVYRQMLEGWDMEDAPTRFTVNTVQAGQQGSRFR